ncbi:MAG TPA: 3-isopropylmalate dehydratase large subunit, partial [Acidobacteriota bacterium]|nr:3-isopropylmalate dehydratase large subunit [Acidobacteriota bacterium]
MKTLYDKIWEDHIVWQETGRPALLYIDLHLIHEVTSPQAFEGLRLAKRKLRRPDRTFATMDHNVPTWERSRPIVDPISAKQIQTLIANCRQFGVQLFDLNSPSQGIVHVIGPELGLTQPGMTIVCGDSHTSTHGAFGALAFGIGTSEVEHVLATQCLQQSKARNFRVLFKGKLPLRVSAKDTILFLIRSIGTDGATGCVLEYVGPVVEGLTMEERMTICNMSIEAGARAGMIAPDDKTFAYIEGRPYAPKGKDFQEAVERWRQLPSDPSVAFDRQLEIDVSDLQPQVSWGTNPGMVLDVNGSVPSPDSFADPNQRKAAEQALKYMDLKPGTPLVELKLDRVFIGSCTNSRIEDLRAAAQMVRGKKVARSVHAMVVPGSQSVRRQAEEEGLDRIFR